MAGSKERKKFLQLRRIFIFLNQSLLQPIRQGCCGQPDRPASHQPHQRHFGEKIAESRPTAVQALV